MSIYDAPTRYDLVTKARVAWDSLLDLRTRRARSRNYFRNRPDEWTVDDNGYPIKEDDKVTGQGRIPLHLSRIGKVVTNLQGQYRSINMQRIAYGTNKEDNEAGDIMTEALRACVEINETQELDARNILEMILAGIYGWKETYTWLPQFNRKDCYVQNLDITRFFFNPDVADVRTHDINLVGELHDVTVDELIAWLAKDQNDEKQIREICRDTQQWAYNEAMYTTGFNSRDLINFFNCNDPTKNRIIEVWNLEYGWKNFLIDPATGSCEENDMKPEEIQRLNLLRQQEALQLGLTPPPPIEQFPKYERVWKVYFLTPMGHVLYEAQTPYTHEEHPYTFGYAMLIDGEIWGPAEEMIEPQRHINRINSVIDYAIGTGAKGVLLVHEDSIPEGMTIDDFAREWSRFGGVIKFKGKPGVQIPKQIIQNAIPEGLFTWLENMYRDMREMSGVQQANMGTTPPAGTPAALYQTQVMQGQVTNRSFFDSFFAVRRKRDLKMVKIIAQYYDTIRMIKVAGKRPDGNTYVTYDPSRIREIEWDLTITEAQDTPVTRQMMEDYLMSFLNSNRITFGQYLQMTDHPKANLIMSIIQKTNPLLADTKIGMTQYGNLVMQLQQQANAGNSDSLALLQQAQ